MSSSGAEVNAALALTSLSFPVATPKVQLAARHEVQAQLEVRGSPPPPPPPLIFVGVTLERRDHSATSNKGDDCWGMTLFPVSQCLVVGSIRQGVLQDNTSWAWATPFPPRVGGIDFRSSFGPLFPTSLLQLVPGDLILSVNGEAHPRAAMMWNAPRLDIVAVRLESARRAAHQVLSNSSHCVEHAAYRAAQVAFETMKPWLPHYPRGLGVVPQNVSRRNSLPEVQTATSAQVRPTTAGQGVLKKQIVEAQAAKMSPPVSHFPEWLTARKAMWREQRLTRKRLRTEIEHVHLPQTTPSVYRTDWLAEQAKRQRLSVERVSPQPHAPPREPLVFLSFKLERSSLATPWGIHVSHHDGRLLGVGRASDAVAGSTKWGCATTTAISASLLSVADELVVRSLFESQTRHTDTFLRLQEGDFILSVSGRPVSSFASLEDIANVMKQSTTLLLIVVRHHEVSDLAKCAMQEGKNTTEISSTAFYRLSAILRYFPTTATLLFPHLGAPAPHRKRAPVFAYRNPLFRDDKGVPILFEQIDNHQEHSGTDVQFLPSMTSKSFASWLEKRKATWRQNWNIRVIDFDGECCQHDDSAVATDFWTRQGYATFGQWLEASTFKWKQSYSWNRRKREKVARACEEVVHFPADYGREEIAIRQAHHWLSIRKQQWRLLRRKRQRRLEEQANTSSPMAENPCSRDLDNGSKSDNSLSAKLNVAAPHADFPVLSPRSVIVPRQTSGEMTIIDALLEEQEREQKVLEDRPPLDIHFLFDARIGAPDDVVAHCLEYLPRPDHGTLLCISSETSAALKERGDVWRQLCPSHWVLPRRPRKQWHELYITKIRREEKESRKWADDILHKAHDILFKADHLNKIEKLVEQGEKRAEFNINYTSGVVCERNSLLNLAVIYSRSKVARWLVESKGADIKTYDRGGFTPLLNAAYGGDRSLVRFLLNHGADRSKIGYCHFFEPLAPPDFKGLNAAGWARKKGHPDLAELITLGL